MPQAGQWAKDLVEFVAGFWHITGMTDEQRKRLKRIMKDGLRIQDRFAAEPVLARTGKGYLKSEGVATLQKIKANLRKSAVPQH